jgi:hypothetical protein
VGECARCSQKFVLPHFGPWRNVDAAIRRKDLLHRHHRLEHVIEPARFATCARIRSISTESSMLAMTVSRQLQR